MIIKIINKINSIHKNLLFVFVWLIITILFGYYKTVFYPPLSVHQGAQADRASIAYNFYSTSMNFFEPRVMETGTKDGVTPAEFPFVGYTVAVFYKIFGFNDFWYRFVVWCFMGFGFWSAIQLSVILGTGKFVSIILACCWYFSTVLCYYTNNFLPDIASLSLIIYAIFLWFKLRINDSPKFKIMFTVIASLACLIKITSLIFIISIVFTEIIFYIIKRKKFSVLLSCLVVFGLVIIWYFYCKYLETKVGGTYFLMNTEIPKNLNDLKEYFKLFYNNWIDKIYNIPQWILIISGIIIFMFLKINKEFKVFTLLASVGVGVFYILFSKQFRYHDYYTITLMPLSLILIYSAYKFLEKLNKNIAIIVIFSIAIWGMIDAKNGVRLRYTKGNYWYQTFFEPEIFKGTDEWLTKNGISEKHKILVAFDPNPNVMLYMIKRRGYRTFDHSESYIDEKLKITQTMITNDTSKFFRMYPHTRKNLFLSSELNEWKLYKSLNGN